MPVSNTIPTDKAAIQAEINSLLELTPDTTDRGRLHHLLNALVNIPADTPDIPKTLSPTNLGTWSGRALDEDGGFAQVGGNKFKMYVYNDAGVNALQSIASKIADYDWWWCYAQEDTNYPMEMFKLSEITYDNLYDTLAFTTDGYPNWQGGGIDIMFIPQPKSSGGGAVASVAGMLSIGQYTCESTTNSANPADLVDGRNSFVTDANGSFGLADIEFRPSDAASKQVLLALNSISTDANMLFIDPDADPTQVSSFLMVEGQLSYSSGFNCASIADADNGMGSGGSMSFTAGKVYDVYLLVNAKRINVPAA